MSGRVSLKRRAIGRKEGIGDRLSRLRRDRGISQTELGKRVGVSQRQVSSYETHRLRIPAEILLKIADALKVSVYELLGRAASNRSPKNRKLWKVFEKLEKLTPRDQRVVLRYIDVVVRDADGRG